MLCGLKSDLRTNTRCIDMLKAQGLTPVTTEQGHAVARKMGATYMECSAREGRGVKEIFENGITIAVGDDWPGYKQIEAKAAKAEKMRNAGGVSGKASESGVLQVPTKKKKSRSCKIL